MAVCVAATNNSVRHGKAWLIYSWLKLQERGKNYTMTTATSIRRPKATLTHQASYYTANVSAPTSTFAHMVACVKRMVPSVPIMKRIGGTFPLPKSVRRIGSR